MKNNYYPETISIYIDLSHKQSVDKHEVSDGIVLDHNKIGNLVGIDIDHVCTKMDMKEFTLGRLPSEMTQVLA